MKSTRLVLGTLAVTLHMHQTIQCAAAEPATEQYNECKESLIIVPERPPLRDTGWKRIHRGVAESRWEQFANIPQDQFSHAEVEPYLTQPSKKLSADIADIIEHTSQLEYQIACAQHELAHITKEKKKMDEVVRRRLVHTFSAFNTSLGIAKDDDHRKAAFLAKKIVDKKTEREIIERNLAQYISGVVQKHNAQRAAAIDAHWAPTKDMNAISYALYYPAHAMSAPSDMTIDEALKTEFGYADEKQVAQLITYAKTLWPTMQEALKASAAIPNDIASQEHQIQNLEARMDTSRSNEDIMESLRTTLAAETKKLHALKLIRFANLYVCERSIATMSNEFDRITKEMFVLEQNAERAKEDLQELLGTVLYDARARGLDVPTAIAQTLPNVRNLKASKDAIVFLTDLYEENTNPDDAVLLTEKEVVQDVVAPSEAPQHFLSQVITKKATEATGRKINSYHRHITLAPVLEKKHQDIKAKIMPQYAQHLKTYKPVTHHIREEQVKSLEASLASRTASRFEAIQSLCKAEESEEGTMTSPESASSSSSSESESESEDESESDDDSATDSDEDTESEAPENN